MTMAKKERSAIDAMIALNNKKNSIKNSEKMARLKAEKAKVEAKIKKAEAEERAKKEKELNVIYNKISKEIKSKTGIMQFLRNDAQYILAEDFEKMISGIIEAVKMEVEITTEKAKNNRTEGEENGKEHIQENEKKHEESVGEFSRDLHGEEQKEEQESYQNGEGANQPDKEFKGKFFSQGKSTEQVKGTCKGWSY